MTGTIDLPTHQQICCSDLYSPPVKDYEPDMPISKSADMPISKSAAVDKSMEPLPLFESEMGISEKDMQFLVTSIESFGSNCKSSNALASNEISPDIQISSYNAVEDSAIKPIALTVSGNELPELDLFDCVSASEESEIESYLSIFEESDSDCNSSPDHVAQDFSYSNLSTSKEECANSIIPTPTNSSPSCGNSLSFSARDIPEISPYIKPYQEKNWLNRFKELQQFHKEEGHCCVPNVFPKHRKLANWVKRQRREYKHMKNGRKSAMTSERINMLNSINFIWDSHDVIWRERLQALKAFRLESGHCNVPYRYSKDKQLGTWVKGQRHQYKLYREGKPSSMNPRRIFLLRDLEFEWVGRSVPPKSLKASTIDI